MIGNFKIIGIIFLFLIFSCKKQNGAIEDGRELITENINVLLDSVEFFDTSRMPVSSVSLKDFKKYKPVKIKQIKIGLLDSITNENLTSNEKSKFVKFNIGKNEIFNFRSKYIIEILKINNYDSNILFVKFSNFRIENNLANIEVKKVSGISMTHHKYYFKKKNGRWVFIKKELLGIG
ncbi:hypothetical protein [uncultured Flavobacterium sp.]|uniref:hypothetical protein n=1 Tax=uncultured Flavobacterium sp. TaxID=165435 RepID=UPI00292F85C2|nr:hypothetical protein [uncultured Flavobacterium sp.]